jgi:hypothetical protein
VGGAIVAWYDFRTGSAYDIYAEHVLVSGVPDPAWPPDGRAVCTATSDQISPQVMSDGAGGAIVAWMDYRSGASFDVYAQHVLASGVADPAWPVDGRAVCTASNGQEDPQLLSDGAGGAIVGWYDYRQGTADVYVQRIAHYGYLGSPEPEIVSVRDVPNDQGGRVKLSWNASYTESDPYSLVTYYKVFRSVPPNLAASLEARGARVIRAETSDVEALDRPGDLLTTIAASTTYYWEYVATVNVDYLTTYSYLAPTVEDSTAAGAPATAFMVQARTAGSVHWESLPMSGYSVDNVAPATPAPFTGQYAAGTALLHWNPNTESDLAGYRLYRGSSASFVPGPGNLVTAKPDTGYADNAGQPYYYKLTAVDVHGNESPVATLLPLGTVGVEGGALPAVVALSAPWPNPTGTKAALRYALPRAGEVRLVVYDAAGRLVRELARGVEAAGEHAADWDLRDGAGGPVRAGLYFARLESDGVTRVRSVAVMR